MYWLISHITPLIADITIISLLIIDIFIDITIDTFIATLTLHIE